MRSYYPKSNICLFSFMLFVCSRAPGRLLESRPPFTTTLHKYPGPANYHRGVWFLRNAQGLLPLPAGWLETWDSGDVWPTQGQRKGKRKKVVMHWISEPSLLGPLDRSWHDRLPAWFAITGQLFPSRLCMERILQASGVAWNGIDFFFFGK